MRAVVFATAGHIDHGKTGLVTALTGVDTDRLDEEKRRGITIVLGFAPLADPAGELEISFVDVPGHERLVHTMVAGAGAVDRALLVVAADEGIMPQTREHLDVLDLLSIDGGVVALNKTDLVNQEILQERIAELHAGLAGGPLRGAPIVPCSAVTGVGVEELRAAILESARGARRQAERHRPFRMAFDRVFSLPGAGTVVTGTVRWGAVREGEELHVLPEGRTVRVRGVQVHGERRETATVGERAALRLAGAGVEQLVRGDQLVGPGPWEAVDRLAVRVRLLAGVGELAEGDDLWLHLLAGRRRARIERLHEGGIGGDHRWWAILRLNRGMFAAPGDRVVLRRLSPVRTIGGGVVVDPQPPIVRRRDVGAAATAPDPFRDTVAALESWIVAAGPGGAERDRLAARLGMEPEGLDSPLGELVAAGRAAAARGKPPLLVATAVASAIESAAHAVLEEAGGVGLPLAELLSRVVPTAPSRIREFYLERFRRAGLLREVGGRVIAARLAPIVDSLAGTVEAAYREAGFEAPSPEELARRIDANPKTVAGIVRFLIDGGRLIRVGGKWVLSRELVDSVVESIRGWGIETFDVGQFKERFSLTRKLAIPLLEWLDSNRVTRREGDRRRILTPR